MMQFLFVFVQFSWGIIQNIAGLIGFLILAPTHKHETYHNAVVTYVSAKNFGGVSMGMFIFMNPDKSEEWKHDTRIHEYGHCFQSILLGPLYLIVIGLPSSIWCNFPVFTKMRREKNISYYWLFCEGWANIWGRLASRESFVTKDMLEHAYFGKPIKPAKFELQNKGR